MNGISVGIGGFFGALGRYFIGQLIPPLKGFPLGTCIINLLGCFFLGWFLTVTAKRWKLSNEVRLGISTGVAGGFTTFSTFCVESVKLIEQQQIGMFLLYIGSSIIMGIAMCWVGIRIAREN
ncbi:fluoride efflux transporter CrcB [Lutibacter sp. B2]|nr:fluoride efflux transporter CrcB [Lutibacter sp. B2]